MKTGNLLIRSAGLEDARAIAEVSNATWQAAYKNIIPASYLSNLDVNQVESRWQNNIIDGRKIFVALIDNKITGFASGGKSYSTWLPFDAELYSIYILPENQGIGLGRTLFLNVIDYLIKNTFESMLVWVLTDNLSCKFYEKLGGKIIAKRQEEIRA